LKDVAQGLLLLTATPLQLHRFELYSLIELIEPGLYSTFEHYEYASSSLPQLNSVMKDLLSLFQVKSQSIILRRSWRNWQSSTHSLKS
jgi:hypothetical protein